ncbi:hypothetical protein KDW_17890 [Dictyobacter vulcani]|uniref:ABC3 transporter permease C-terminal domain-containing protein n=1 Tax=Dictyobacter vulcani TaxID=2607529 RepID=A0A5J4KMH2_9CHLR|nr:ABC transporter permease [Dictyobacter vulcani]GER87627.1 hypothetical protein KDW_17890 [Dictyobacter vulcani]
MPRSMPRGKTSERRLWLPAFLPLAWWQLRRTKGLLTIVGLGVLTAVVFVCVAPLYTQVAINAGLQEAVNATPANSSISIVGKDAVPRWESIQAVTAGFADIGMRPFSQLLDRSKDQLQIESGQLQLYPRNPDAGNVRPLQDTMLLEGNDMVQTASGKHLTLLQGRLPTPQVKSYTDPDSTIEIALSKDTAADLQVSPGSMLYTRASTRKITASSIGSDWHLIPLKVVGIFQNIEGHDPFWHGSTLDKNYVADKPDGPFIFKALASNDALVSTYAGFIPSRDEPKTAPIPDTGDIDSVPASTHPLPEEGKHPLLDPLTINWYFSLDPQKISSDQLADLVQMLQTFQDHRYPTNILLLDYGISETHAFVPVDGLTAYQSQLAVLQIPAMGLVIAIFCLLLYFVALMADLLVERQSAALAIVRSRGGSRGQVFGALLSQGIGVCLLALLLGPLLTLLVATGLSWIMLPRQDYAAVSDIWLRWSQSLLLILPYAVLTVIVVVLTLTVAIYQATAFDVLALRRESGRATHKPLWLRFGLDFFAIVVMIVGYGLSIYLTDSDVLDPRLRLLLLSPLVLARAVFTIIAAILLFLRLFPYLLRWCSWWATRYSRGAASMLAFAQLARSPRQSLRIALLFALATAFAIFALVFSSSQFQRTSDVATQTVGADFSGTFLDLPDAAALATKLQTYSKLKGVQGVTAGYSDQLQVADQEIHVRFLAMDADTYPKVAYWPENNTSMSLPQLMQQLAQGRKTEESEKLVPAAIDESLASSYHLNVGSKFGLNGAPSGEGVIYFKVIAIVKYIPTQSPPGGVLVDLRAYQKAYNRVVNIVGSQPLSLNQLWLRTTDDPVRLTEIRHELISGNTQLATFTDRRQLMNNLQKEPLYLQLIGVLALGPLVALLLVLMGSLLASWLQARDRLTNFAIMRALGASPGNITSTLAWEQAIVYAVAIMLGAIFGSLLSWMVVPVLVFTSSPPQQSDVDAFYLAQSIPPVQIVVPALLGIGLAILVMICVLALGMMLRMITRPSLAMTLRISED